jgi:hypothetical protein
MLIDHTHGGEKKERFEHEHEIGMLAVLYFFPSSWAPKVH